MIAGIVLWWRKMALRSEIAGYDEDIETLRMLGHAGGKSELMILARKADAQHELYLLQRQGNSKQITN